MDEMFDRLQAVVDRYDELNELISDPEVIADTQRFMTLSKEEGELRDTVETYRKYKQVTDQLNEDNEMLHEKLDDDMEQMVKDELKELEPQKEELEDHIRVLLLPKDPNDDKNIVMEIHGAAGGDEASLFAADLFNMYSRYAEKQGWSVEIVDQSATEVGGFKEIVLLISGNKVYSKLKYESGAHRVQRVPVTESAGRLHTSTATVGVMPEAEEVDIDIDPKDIRTDVYRSSGAGGQHINKTSSAVRMTHLPTGSLWPCKMNGHNNKTGRRPCRFCGPGSTTTIRNKKKTAIMLSESQLSEPVTGQNGFGRTTIRKTGSRITELA